jgi:hypothetical protein
LKPGRVLGALCFVSAFMLTFLLALTLSRSHLPFQTMFFYIALLGGAVGGLLYIGVDVFLTFGRGKTGEGGGLVLVRSRDGRVLSVKGEGESYIVRSPSARSRR